jgi:EAL domain-containing protein (putative c-di-GMP-specific phosphodiesterase class I)
VNERRRRERSPDGPHRHNRQEGCLDRPRDPLPTRVDGCPPLPPAYHDALDGSLAALGIPLAAPARTAIDGHVRLLLAWNAAINLTAIRDPASIAIRHVVDSLIGAAVLSARGFDRFVDLGSGGSHILTPDQFLPPAERLGLMPDIDRFMVERAIALLAAQPDSSVCLDVNLSGSALSDPSLLHFIEDELKLAQVAATRFGVEITETTAVSDIRKAQEFVTRLKTIGCRVSLDDFGSGFSSFYYLKHLPIDALKIDGSFVSGIAGNGQDMHLVRALIELCRALGVESTAEYVEDGETLGLLRELDADYAQGFHVGRPMPVEQVLFPAEGAGAA